MYDYSRSWTVSINCTILKNYILSEQDNITALSRPSVQVMHRGEERERLTYRNKQTGVSNLNSPVTGSLIKLSLRPLAHKILLCLVMCVPSTTFLCHTSNCQMQVYRFVQLMALQTPLNLRPDQILLHGFVQPTQLDPHSHSTQRHPAM